MRCEFYTNHFKTVFFNTTTVLHFQVAITRSPLLKSLQTNHSNSPFSVKLLTYEVKNHSRWLISVVRYLTRDVVSGRAFNLEMHAAHLSVYIYTYITKQRSLQHQTTDAWPLTWTPPMLTYMPIMWVKSFHRKNHWSDEQKEAHHGF